MLYRWAKANLGPRQPLSDVWADGAVPTRGYRKLYYDTVLQADQGCDFDFLKSD